MVIKNLKQANEALHRIAEIDSSISREESLRTAVIVDADKSFLNKTEGLVDERTKIIDQLKKFSDEHRSEFIPEGKMSADIGNGTLGYRKTPDKVEVCSETAELLEECGFGAMVKVTKEPVKAAVKNLPDDVLAKVKAKKVPGTEQFFAKANEVRYTETDTVA